MHQVPITAGWTKAVWNTKSTRHFCTWPALGIEPRHSDLESNALSIGPHAPTLSYGICYHIREWDVCQHGVGQLYVLGIAYLMYISVLAGTYGIRYSVTLLELVFADQ